jgi:coenzyme F420-reducing hydrogenase delta subunit
MVDSSKWEPKIVAFLCNWCSYAGADLAGTSRIQYPPNVRIIRVPCSGRVNPFFILSSLQKGVDGVLVSGCHPGDCHYINGNFKARRRIKLLKEILPRFGFEPERLRLTWIGASDGIHFAEIMCELVAQVKALGPNRAQLAMAAG